jgi:type II secretory pathway predicted ATPase ExeA
MSTDLRSAFGFTTTPFTREIPCDQMILYPMHEQALDGLRRAIERRMSAVFIAPAGTGKTALLRKLITQLPEARYLVHYVKVTELGKRDMCREIASVCSVPPVGSYPSLLRKLQARFEGSADNDGIRPVLIIDEAQDLRVEVLSMLRVLTNFQMDSRLVLSVVLAGQPALKKMLAGDELEAVARRMAHYASLRPLSRDETTTYIEHRITIDGVSRSPFDKASIDAIYEISRGNLRAIDSLALESLEIVARAGLKVVSAQHVAAARKGLWP